MELRRTRPRPSRTAATGAGEAAGGPFRALADGLALHALAASEPPAARVERLRDGMLTLWRSFAPPEP